MLLTNLVTTFRDRTDKAVTVGAQGIHAMRFLPSHPSVQRLKEGGNVAANVQRLQSDASAKSDEPMSQGKAEYLCGKAVDSFMKDLLGGEARVAAARLNLPTPESNAAMTPAQLKAHLLTNFDGEAREAGLARISNAIDTFLLRELDFPEVVITDTNWGGAKGKIFHAIAPDPSTGKLVLWKKTEPQGSYERETDDWLEQGWEYIGEPAPPVGGGAG
jgi:hypothetical protein